MEERKCEACNGRGFVAITDTPRCWIARECETCGGRGTVPIVDVSAYVDLNNEDESDNG